MLCLLSRCAASQLLRQALPSCHLHGYLEVYNRQIFTSVIKPQLIRITTTDFGDLRLYRATEKDSVDIRNFMVKDFLINEPLNKAIGFAEVDSEVFFDSTVKASVASSFSYLLRDTNGNIAAVELCSPMLRSKQQQNVRNPKDDLIPELTGKAMLIENILVELESKIWPLMSPEINRLLVLNIISVDSKYRRLGLAAKLIDYSMDDSREMGCYQGMITEATAINSQLLFKKLGFKTIFKIDHAKWLDANGNRIFVCEDRTISANLMFRKF